MSDMSGRILECVQTSGLNDYDQRSALGLARAWIEKQKPIRRSEIAGHEKRDDLAEALVGILDESAADPEEGIEAIAAARAVINRPFQNPALLASKTIVLVKPKDR